MSKKISFIHAADLHLDSLFKGLANVPETIFHDIRNSTFRALDNVIQTAINKQVDFVLIVGDLFDNDKQSLKAQIHLRDAFEKLEAAGINVYLSYGNHDYINGNIHPISYPKNVYIFPNERVASFTFEKNKEQLARIYGFSYENRAILKNKTDEYVRKQDDIPFHIATLHGTLNGNEHHDSYAPFHLSQLKEKPFHYWALGHIHKREILSENPPIVYPGNIQGRHRNEAGEKGSYYVEMTDNGVQLEFIRHQEILFEEVEINLNNCNSMTDVESLLKEKLIISNDKKLIYVHFVTENSKWLTHEREGHFTQLLEILNDVYVMNPRWIYMYHYRLTVSERKKINYNDFFIGQLAKTMDELDVHDAIKDLYEHQDGRKFLSNMDEVEIRQAAEQLLFHKLIRMNRGDSE